MEADAARGDASTMIAVGGVVTAIGSRFGGLIEAINGVLLIEEDCCSTLLDDRWGFLVGSWLISSS